MLRSIAFNIFVIQPWRFGTNGTGHQSLVDDTTSSFTFHMSLKLSGSSLILKSLSSALPTSLVVAPPPKSPRTSQTTYTRTWLIELQLRQASLRSTLNEASASRRVPIECTTLSTTTTFEPPTNPSLAPGHIASVQVAPRVDAPLPPPKDSHAVSVHSVRLQLASPPPNNTTRQKLPSLQVFITQSPLKAKRQTR